jgi:hypothetical protein
MSGIRFGWIGGRFGRLTGLTMLLLVGVVLTEGYLLLKQRTAVRATFAAPSNSILSPFGGDSAASAGLPGVPIRMQNVRFKWSDGIFIDAGSLAVRAVPNAGSTVDFDDLTSFRLVLQQSVVTIRPDVLQAMFNESVFKYPHSRVRDLRVTLVPDDDVHVVQVKGHVNFGVWIPFAFSARLLVDAKTNTLGMDVDHLKILGIVPAGMFTKLVHLENIIALPPNNSVLVDGNRLLVKPLGLFPPPRIDGTLSSVEVGANAIRLTFSGSPVAAPQASADNYVYLKGGASQFGQFRMVDTNILIRDQNPANPFVFSLVHYADMISRSVVQLHDTKSVEVTMPDWSQGGQVAAF